MSADLNFTMELDLLESLDEPTLPIVFIDSLDAASGGVQPAVILAAKSGDAFITGGRMIRTTPPSPPPRRVARGTMPNVPLVAARVAKR